MIVILTFVGSLSIQQNMFDVLTMIGAGIFGYTMTKFDYTLSPVALELFIGPMLEEAIMLTNTMYEDQCSLIFTQPLTNIFALFILFSVFWPLIKSRLKI